jgi:hypothetical protein
MQCHDAGMRLPIDTLRFLRWSLVLAATAASVVAGAQSQPTPPGDAAHAAWKRIDGLIGPAACRRDSDCATLPLPDQACGGPQGWIAFAPAHTERAALSRALAELPAAAPGAVSTCEWRPDPGAQCRPAAAATPGRCQLRPAGRSGSTH